MVLAFKTLEARRELQRKMDRQVPFALSKALNAVAKMAAREALPDAARDHFKSPVPFTQKGFASTFANKGAIQAGKGPLVLVKDLQAEYLGFRTPIGREGLGAMVKRKPGDKGTFGDGASGMGAPIPVQQRVNKFGNIPRNRVKRLLDAAATGDRRYFVGRIQLEGSTSGQAILSRAFGIYQRPKYRKGGRRRKQGPIKLLVAFDRQTDHRKDFPFFETVRKLVEQQAPAEFSRAMRQAMRSAR